MIGISELRYIPRWCSYNACRIRVRKYLVWYCLAGVANRNDGVPVVVMYGLVNDSPA